MTNHRSQLHDWTLVQHVETLEAVVEHASRASALAIDVEANGLFAYRARLCTVQLAWEEDDRTKIAVIDTLRVNAAALAPLFAAPNPMKVIHDFAFDARMLHENGASLQHVWDTSVAARLLGIKSTGLAALLETELGIVLDKRFQQYDWSRRPLEPVHLAYLSNDVAHLLPLERALRKKVLAMDIAAEIEAECAYKLLSAVAPSRDQRPAYTRVKGAFRLDRVGRAVLMHLVAAREEIAESIDVPPFKVITNEILLEFARKRPRTTPEMGRIRGGLSGRAGRYATRWLAAITAGIEAGDVPSEDRVYFEQPRFDRAAVAHRREIESRINSFRRQEAQRRGVDEQVVLPGHVVHELAGILGTTKVGDSNLVDRIASIAGIGQKRAEQYANTLATLLETAEPTDAAAFQDELVDEALDQAD